MEKKEGGRTAAICTGSRDIYEKIDVWVREYGRKRGIRMETACYPAIRPFLEAFYDGSISIVFLALDDIKNQEIAIRIRQRAQSCEIVWLGEDERFSLFAYRIRAANYLVGPIKAGDIEDSLDRCMENIRLERGVWEVGR